MKPRLTPEQLDQLLVEYGTAMQSAALAGISPAPDAQDRKAQWEAIAVARVREIREGVFQ